jgi:ubiquitin-conjugating enzyme E2 Q
MNAVAQSALEAEGQASPTVTAVEPPHPAVTSLEGLVVSDSEARPVEILRDHSTSNIDVSEDEEGDDESEYEYEDEDDAAFSGFLMTEQRNAPIASFPEDCPARIRDEEETTFLETEEPAKKRWKEPSREAVSMSLRAEREKSGGKRRLASDLYKIMMSDTMDAGFNLEPKSEDSMDKWLIKLFKFDDDSDLHKDMLVLGVDHIELEMSFPDQYPFEPPFVRVVRPRFKKQTGFVMHGALCMELLTKDGWNPVNDIESVIVSIRSLMVVGGGRLAAAVEMSETKREAILATIAEKGNEKRERSNSGVEEREEAKPVDGNEKPAKMSKAAGGQYTVAEAEAAYSHISDYHEKKGWDASGWWARKG